MKTHISSAGLLYLYISGYEENGILYMQQVNNYNHIEDGFYNQLITTAEDADNDTENIHVFAIVGIKEKANKIYSIIESDLKSNYNRILSDKRIKKTSDKLDKTGNVFNRCIQEFFCEQPNHYPKRIHRDYNDFIIT